MISRKEGFPGERTVVLPPVLVSSLRYYVNHRDQYKTLNDFYPEIFQCLKKYLEDEVARMQKPLS